METQHILGAGRGRAGSLIMLSLRLSSHDALSFLPPLSLTRKEVQEVYPMKIIEERSKAHEDNITTGNLHETYYQVSGIQGEGAEDNLVNKTVKETKSKVLYLCIF